MFSDLYLRKEDVEIAMMKCKNLEPDHGEAESQFIYGYRTAMANMGKLVSEIEGITGDVCYHESIKKYIDKKVGDVERTQLMDMAFGNK